MAEVDLSRCSFDKEAKKLTLATEAFGGGFPEFVDVKSHHTGTVVRFVPDREAAEANEGWDGEECHYKPAQPQERVEKLVLHHAY